MIPQTETPRTTAAHAIDGTIDAATLRAWLEEPGSVAVLDVRTPAEYGSLHIAGSRNVPLHQLDDHAASLSRDAAGRRTVLACQSGVRAGQARQRLAAHGIAGAVVLTGGVPGFAAAGGDVVRGRQRWDLDRQVRLAAGSLVLAGLLAGRYVSPRLRALSGAIGAGLAFSAATNTCAMGAALARMPWNRSAAPAACRAPGPGAAGNGAAR